MWAQSHFQIGSTEEGTGPALSVAGARPAGILDQMGDSQSAGFAVLAQRRLSTRKGTHHLSWHHSFVAQQILEGTKIAALSVGTPHILTTFTLRHELFPQAFLQEAIPKKTTPLMELRENTPPSRPVPPLYIGTRHPWVASALPTPLQRACADSELHPRVELATELHPRVLLHSCTPRWHQPASTRNDQQHDFHFIHLYPFMTNLLTNPDGISLNTTPIPGPLWAGLQ